VVLSTVAGIFNSNESILFSNPSAAKTKEKKKVSLYLIIPPIKHTWLVSFMPHKYD
jgi:hypothetical protein